MLQQDYLVRLIMRLIEAITKSLHRAKDDDDPQGAAEMLESAIGEATDIDGAVLLSLAPESIASIMQVSGVDPRVAGYVARSLKLESEYLVKADNLSLAALRLQQAEALGKAYGVDFEMPLEDAIDPETVESLSESEDVFQDFDLSVFGVSFPDEY